MKAREQGFTLVELAIALVVIGLLIGGILKGKELIENARVTAAVKQMSEYRTAAITFRNKYDEYPGDIRDPSMRVPNCTNNPCQQGGNRDDRVNIPWGQYEVYNFYVHMARAGMIEDLPGGTDADMANTTSGDALSLFFPRLKLQTATSGLPVFLRLEYFRMVSGTQPTTSSTYCSAISAASCLHTGTPPSGIDPLTTGHYYILTTTGAQAASLDKKMDDGFPASGDMRSYDYTGCHGTGALTAATPYGLNVSTCRVKIAAGF